MEKIKICHLTSAHNSLDDRIFEKECCSLANLYDTYIIAPGNSFQKEHVNIMGIGERPKSRIKRFFSTGHKVYKAALKLDAQLYHIHDPELLLYARKLKKLEKIVIYDSHEDVPRQILAKEWIPRLIRKMISVIYEYFEKRTAQKIDYIVTATPHIRDVFLKYTKNVCEICNFPIDSSLDIDISKRKYSEKQQQICYAGSLTKIRGLNMMMEAVEKTDCHLKLAGSIDDLEKERIKKFNKVEYIGYLTRDEVNKLYEESNIGIMIPEPRPNHINSYAIKLFEYMGAELPIICSNFPLWKEMIEESGCGICVDPLNEKEVISAIQYLSEHPEIEKEMGRKGKKLVSEKYNWNNEFKKLSMVYQNII